MLDSITRRESLQRGFAISAFLSLLPQGAIPALAQDEVLVDFTDLPENISWTRGPTRRLTDLRRIDGPYTPADQFFTFQHYEQPEVDAASYSLQVTGLVEHPLSLSLAELRALPATELDFGFECSGNRGPLQAMASNGHWTGVRLQTVLERAGVAADAREAVFFGADHGEEDVAFRNRTYTVDQHFGRSLPRDIAMSEEPLLAYALNGEPLTTNQGAPLRLLVPGWYGVANVKWVANIHLQREEFLGRFQARWYRTLKEQEVGGEQMWIETAITRMRVKSFVARVTRQGSDHKLLIVVLNDGTPLRSVEVRIDDGSWQPAAPDPATSGKYSWKLYNFTWSGATPGDHTLVSRATDVEGNVQPVAEDLSAIKKTFLEDNSQQPRTIRIG